MDWNLVIHALDELRDGPRPLLEFAETVSRQDPAACVQTMHYLADREMIALASLQYPFASIPREEWQARLCAAFAGGIADRVAVAATAIDLTDRGNQVMQLFGIGHP
ncbi:hypothetical protein WBP06_00810 [Novosphingobium sp. BL-8H]|uniref:hypothetical protein n=1 Tax=Novosphingobium sp. BL-8H TaxID=3127640 RepID=UPI003757E0D8